jgi:hypothetical protein
MKSNANTAEAATHSSLETPVREAKSVKAVTPTAKSAAVTTVWGSWTRVFIAHPGMQVSVFYVLLLLYIWWIAPGSSPPLILAGLTLLVTIAVTSSRLHGDGPLELGFRLDNLGRSAREVGMATLVAAPLIVAAGAWLGGGLRLHGVPPFSPLGYPVWALVQQYALQGFVYRRLCNSWGRPGIAAAGAALLFGAVHYPNPVLMVSTTVGGYAWSSLYRRAPNLFTLALSHGWLAALLMAAFPPEMLHELRVGPTYWSWGLTL